ncbi:MAG: sigma 54-interacting transcriptional regulator [candidate division WOR-3 bacterium]
MPHSSDALKSAWEKMVKDRNVSKARLEIRESWARCIKMGLDPCSPPDPIISRTTPVLADLRIKSYNRLIYILHERLQSLVNSERFVVITILNDGTLLQTYGHDEILKLIKESGIKSGMKTIEESSGTCAPSLTLISKRLSKVITYEHFFERFHWATCLGFPLYGSKGDLIGVIDITSDHTLKANFEDLYQSLRLNRLLFQDILINPEAKLRDIYYKSYFDATFYEASEPMLLVDRSGFLIDINRNAEVLVNNGDESSLLEVELCELLKEIAGYASSKARRDRIVLEGLSKCYNKISLVPLEYKNKTIGYLVKLQKDFKLLQNRELNVFRKEKEERSIVTKTIKMKQIIERAKIVADTDSPVLIEGETGTGKEVLARYIHAMSSYTKGSFIAINCAAIPLELFESEMFGYERGAYTGARKDGNIGKIELANNGTLFLDEIQALNTFCQAKLLRAIEDKEIYRIGSTKSIKLNFRVISASSSNLISLTKQGKFLEALYYRLRVNYFHLPPLRERREDIAVLADHFLNKLNEKYPQSIKRLDPACYKFLSSFDWPGNIRQLRNLIEEAFVMTPNDCITLEILKSCLFESENLEISLHPDTIGKTTLLDSVIASVAKQCLAESKTITEAAKKLGISRSTLYRKLKVWEEKQNDTGVPK